MSLSSGTSLGPYEILAPIGAGGMGEVYRARDTKLGRDVAIKVLPEEFSQDRQRLARFEREAKLLAQLNHPNIAAIYGFEESEREDLRYLVLELVLGETLAERLARGRLAIEDVLAIARQICDALEEAHERGVIHRDLKPANVKLTEDGKVKVLDFGLAKLAVPDVGAVGDGGSLSPTITRDATRVGVILGTAAYMSPEQARGRAVDKWSDIFSFGSVLYEMLAGRKAFAGEDISEILAAVIKTEPDWSALPPNLDPRLGRLLGRCLKKDPRERLRDIGDARFEIDELKARPRERESTAKPASLWRRALPWTLATAALVAAVVSWRRPAAEAPRPVRMQVALPPDVVLAVDTEHPVLAVSPDGRSLVFVGEKDGIRRLYRRDLSAPEAQVIAGTEDAASPFFSPDGNWVGFIANWRLEKVPFEGGVPVAVLPSTPVGVSRGITWGSGEMVIQAESVNSGLSVASVTGDGMHGIDEWKTVTEPTAATAWPCALPDGGQILFVDGDQSSPDETRISVLALDTRKIETVIHGGTSPRYSSTGHVLFARNGSLYAVAFDPGTAKVTGNERKVLDGVMTAKDGAAQFAVGAGGTLAYVAGEADLGDHELVWVDRKGRTETILDGAYFSEPRISPDGTRLLVTGRTGANIDVWILDLERSTFTRLTSDSGERLRPGLESGWKTPGSRIGDRGTTGERRTVSRLDAQRCRDARGVDPESGRRELGVSFVVVARREVARVHGGEGRRAT